MILAKAFGFVPIIAIISVIGVIISISMSQKHKRTSKIILGLVIGTVAIYMFFVMGIVAPYIFIGALFEGAEGYIWMFAIAVITWLVVSIGIRFKNNIIKNNNKIKDIYVRDVDVEYSPAVCSYLINNKKETKKDLTATLLNLCAKNIVKIENNGNNINIIDLKNVKEVEKLAEDEKYAYEMLCSKVTSNKLIQWKNIVENEYKKYNFSKQNEKPLGMYIFGAYIAVFILIFAFFLITGEDSITGNAGEFIAKLVITLFMAAWETLLVSGYFEGIKEFLKRNINSSFKDTYTSKGAREFNKWRKFMDFIRDFSLIDEKGHA